MCRFHGIWKLNLGWSKIMLKSRDGACYILGLKIVKAMQLERPSCLWSEVHMHVEIMPLETCATIFVVSSANCISHFTNLA